MISLIGLIRLLKLPLDILFVVIKYFLGATKFRKFSKSLQWCIRLTLYRQAMLIPIPDTKYLSLMSNLTLLKLVAKSFAPVVKTLPGYGEKYGPAGIWITKDPNRSKLDPVLIYLHGGGYFLQTQHQQLEAVIGMYKLVDPSKKLSILFLDYDLVSFNHQFPRQLRQLDSIYTKLVEEGNDNLLLMGDSAGGHLAITYTQYITMKKPYLPYPEKLVLISPWVDMATDSNDYKPGLSYYDNQPRDIINFNAFAHGDGLLFIEDSNRVHHEYFDWSYRGAANWDKNPFFNLKDNKHEVLLILGEDESFRDHILEWVNQIYGLGPIKNLGHSNNKFITDFDVRVNSPTKPNLTMFIEPWGIHDAFCFTDFPILAKLKKNKPFDKNEFFSISRVADFLS